MTAGCINESLILVEDEAPFIAACVSLSYSGGFCVTKNQVVFWCCTKDIACRKVRFAERNFKMNHIGYREEQLYLDKEEQIGQEAMEVVRKVIAMNNSVGSVVGYYDENLTILSVSDYLLNTLD